MQTLYGSVFKDVVLEMDII